MKKQCDRKHYTIFQHIRLIFRGYKTVAALPKSYFQPHLAKAITASLVPFVNIYFSAQIINELTGARNENTLILLASLTVGINFIVLLTSVAASRWVELRNLYWWGKIDHLFSNKMLSMDYADLEDPEIRKKYTEVTRDMTWMGFGLTDLWQHLIPLVTGVLQIALSIALALSIFRLGIPQNSPMAWLDSPFMIAAALLVLACSMLVPPWLVTRGGKIWAKKDTIVGRLERVFNFFFFRMIDSSGPAKDIRVYEQKSLVDSSLAEWQKELDGTERVCFRHSARYETASAVISFLCSGLIYLYIALRAFAGAYGVGSIVMYAGAIAQFGGGLAVLLENIGGLINNNPFLDKGFQFLDAPSKKRQGSRSVEKDMGEYKIEFCNVSFRYPGTEDYALRHLNLSLNAGRRMAVVGMNGSGKTTMIKLLCRLYDQTEGIITLNGVDIKEYDYDGYMALFGVVFQDFQLLPFLLGQNVAAATDVDREKAESALGKAGFRQRLSTMPKGLDTVLYKNFEKDGVDISGGEAQKIALARALYKDAPFIVLDEPTATLDPVAEYEMYSTFNEIVGDKTVIYISHRLSSCRFCDDIAVFHEGGLLERGSHEALLADKSGKYNELWNAQAQYYASRPPTDEAAML